MGTDSVGETGMTRCGRKAAPSPNGKRQPDRIVLDPIAPLLPRIHRRGPRRIALMPRPRAPGLAVAATWSIGAQRPPACATASRPAMTPPEMTTPSLITSTMTAVSPAPKSSIPTQPILPPPPPTPRIPNYRLPRFRV